MNYEQDLRKLHQDAHQAEMFVLIWGPGDPGDVSSPAHRYWEKRCQIRMELRKEFPNAGVYFSEDDEVRRYTAHLGDVLTEEWMHAEKADCILVLDVSRGAHVEVDIFSAHPRIAAKMRLLLPTQFVGTTGLVSVIHRRVTVIGFSEDEFERCTLATKKCIDIVRQVAMLKVLATLNGGRQL